MKKEDCMAGQHAVDTDDGIGDGVVRFCKIGGMGGTDMKTGSEGVVGMRIDPMTESEINGVGVLGDIDVCGEMHWMNVVFNNEERKRGGSVFFTFHDPENGLGETVDGIGVGDAADHFNMPESIIQ